MNPEDSSTLSSASVTFEPSARSAWHSHPKGQLLIVTDGNGLIQKSGGTAQKIKEGDALWTAPGVKHWHGASADSSLTHVVVQEFQDGKNVNWMEKVSEEDYKNATR